MQKAKRWWQVPPRENEYYMSYFINVCLKQAKNIVAYSSKRWGQVAPRKKCDSITRIIKPFFNQNAT